MIFQHLSTNQRMLCFNYVFWYWFNVNYVHDILFQCISTVYLGFDVTWIIYKRQNKLQFCDDTTSFLIIVYFCDCRELFWIEHCAMDLIWRTHIQLFLSGALSAISRQYILILSLNWYVIDWFCVIFTTFWGVTFKFWP